MHAEPINISTKKIVACITHKLIPLCKSLFSKIKNGITGLVPGIAFPIPTSFQEYLYISTTLEGFVKINPSSPVAKSIPSLNQIEIIIKQISAKIKIIFKSAKEPNLKFENLFIF